MQIERHGGFKIHFDVGNRGESSIKNFTEKFYIEQLGGMDGDAIYQDEKDQEKVEREEIESSELHIVRFEIPVNLPNE